MSRNDIVTALFGLVMVANIIAFVRHWRMMRAMNIALSDMIETQKQFSAMMDAEIKKARARL